MLAAGGQSIFAALSFAGYLFKMFNKNGYKKEIRRQLGNRGIIQGERKILREGGQKKGQITRTKTRDRRH